MFLASEVVNDNGISSLALAFFTALFAMLTPVLVQVFKNKTAVRNLRDAVDTAAESAEAAKENTASVSNGFTSRLDRRFDSLDKKQDRLNELFQSHLEWHLHQETSERKGTQR